MTQFTFRKTGVLLVVLALTAGCAAGRAYRRADNAARSGDWDTAVQQYQRAVQAAPDRAEYRIALERAMLTASQRHLDTARVAEARGQIEDALREYRRASEYDPTNRQVAAKVLETERRIRDQAETARANTLRDLREQARAQGPQPLMNLKTVMAPLRFINTQLRDIFAAIGQTTGINVTFDTQFPERAYTVQMENVTLQEALDQIVTANQLFYKVVNQRTILIAQDTAAKRQQYEELVIKTYYISNADPTEIQATLNSIVRGGIGNQQLQPLISATKGNNTLTVRATEAMIAIVDRLVEAADKPKAEIVVDIQILEVNRARAKQFGIDLVSYTVGGVFSPESAPAAAGQPPFNANAVSRGISTADFYLSVPSALVRFLETDTDTKLIAKPQLRGSEGTLLKLNLGDEIPVATTSFAALSSGGPGVNPLVSYTYRPVGINVEVMPRVSFEGDIRLELIVESSFLGPNIAISDQSLPSFGTRKVTTTSRLREGESTLLAGLLREEQRTVLKGFPWLLRLPLIRQLFSANDSNISQTDLIMLLTPRIVRSHELTPQNLAPIYIGTSTNIGLTGPPASLGDPAAAPPAAVPPPAAQGQAAPTAPLAAPAIPGGPQGAVPGLPVTTAAGGGQVILSLPGTEFRVGGGPYTVPISIANASQLSNVSLTVTYNPAALRVRTVQEGTFMRAGGVSAAFTQQADAAAGRVDIAIARTGDTTGVAGTGMLAALLFEAIGPGPANLAISATATAPGGGQVGLTFLSIAPVTVR